MSDSRTIQFRLVMGKGDERVSGPDDADTVATIAKADATMDLSVAFMKSKGSLGTSMLDSAAWSA